MMERICRCGERGHMANLCIFLSIFCEYTIVLKIDSLRQKGKRKEMDSGMSL